MHPLQSESSEHVAAALQENFTSKQLESVQYVTTDSPSGKFFSEILMICPNIRSMMLGSVHLAIVFEYSFWNKTSPGPKQLREVLRKTTALDTEVGENCWGSFYNGDMSRPLNKQESKYRDMILNFSMPSVEAGVIFDTLVDHRPSFGVHQMSSSPYFASATSGKCVAKQQDPTNRSARSCGLLVPLTVWSGCATLCESVTRFRRTISSELFAQRRFKQ